MQPFFIFHFRPLEHYPPIQNLLRYLNTSNAIEKVYCISTLGQFKKEGYGEKVRLFRLGKVGGSKLYLWFTYLYYNFIGILLLLIKRPKQLMYYESLSAFPVYFYKRYINTKAKIFIHYHEYTAPQEYENASVVERIIHRKEKYLYAKVHWISHTNAVRLQKFLEDNQLAFDKKIHQTMPNYPSKSWAIQNRKWKAGELLKIIYVGYNVNSHSNYIYELINFLKNAEIKSEFRIYCVEKTVLKPKYLGEVGNTEVIMEAAVSYEKLPVLLSNAHVGVILYKGVSFNSVHIAPNKFFEYLSCGLDVWYSDKVKGLYSYDNKDSPKVIRLEMDRLAKYDLKELLKESETKNKMVYFAEAIYETLLKALKTNK